jgi:hypothetical protein
MRKQQIQSINLMDLEKGVVTKFGSSKRISTVLKNTLDESRNYLSPLATLCFVLACGVKNGIIIDKEELKKIIDGGKIELNISYVEYNILLSYKKYLDQIGFEIPKPNRSMPLKVDTTKMAARSTKTTRKRVIKKKSADKQLKFGF